VKITVLAYREKGAAELDAAIGQVNEALQAAGHQTTTVAIHSDLNELLAAFEESRPDLVFNLVESFGDDILGGQMGVAGILDLLQLHYTGGGPGELYLQEDKALAKKLLSYSGVLYPDYATFIPGAELDTNLKLHMPLFVKPLRLDASLGIDERSVVKTKEELKQRVLDIQKKFGHAALAEEFIDGREFYVGVLGNESPVALPPIEMDFSGLPEGSLRIMDNKAKFDESSERYHGTRAVVVQNEPELVASLQKTALDAYSALRVCDYGRIDLRVGESGEIYVIEVNANCYLEKTAEFAQAAEAHGLDYVALISQIVDLASERWRQRTTLRKRPRKRAAKASKKLPASSATSSPT
jgi:D-alanine-D-alanine ligase